MDSCVTVCIMRMVIAWMLLHVLELCLQYGCMLFYCWLIATIKNAVTLLQYGCSNVFHYANCMLKCSYLHVILCLEYVFCRLFLTVFGLVLK